MTSRHPVAGAVTLQQVADAAGVSLATASRAINGSSRTVRQDLRDLVLATATRLSYSANAQAQAMARGRTNVVGLLVHDIADPYFSSIAAGVIGAAEAHGLLVTVGSTSRNPERELDYLQTWRGQRDRATILAGSRVDDPALTDRLADEVRAFEQTGGRVVVISQQRLPASTVVVENRRGARQLATTLAELGYTRYAVLAGPRRLLTARDRLDGFREGLARAGVRAKPVVVHGEFTRDGGFEAMSEVLDSRADVDCVFGVNDVMAVGAMAACRARGLRLPEDIALAGFDDISALRDIHPGLTTVALPLERMGATAVDLVMALPGNASRTRRVRGEVIVRASTPRRL